MLIEFGEWLPDLPDFNNPGATVVKNCLPAGTSYQPFNALVTYSTNGLDARCQGAYAAKDSAGNTTNFAGDASKLYQLSSGSWSNVSQVGGYTTASDERWNFAKVGEIVIATNISEVIQGFDLSSSSAFSDLSATAPKARYLAQVRDFLVVGNTFDTSDGSVPHRVRHPAIGDVTDWTVSPATQANFYDLNSSDGWVKQIVGGEYGVIFQERAITRMDYIGSPSVFQMSKIESNRGTQAPGSVVKVGNFIAYLGLDGFYIFDGNQSIPIGTNKIDKTFYADLDSSYFDRICSAVDSSKQIIYWGYPNADAIDGNPNRFLCYNYSPNATKRWSLIDSGIDIEALFTSFSEGYTLDSLDAISTSIDALEFSLDSRVWTGDDLLLSAFNSTHKLANFTGSALTATIETQEAQISPNSRTNLTRLRPVVDGSGTVTMNIGTRNLQSGTVSYGSTLSTDMHGFCTTRSNARYHRARVSIAGGFNDAIGVEIVEAKKAGVR